MLPVASFSFQRNVLPLHGICKKKGMGFMFNGIGI